MKTIFTFSALMALTGCAPFYQIQEALAPPPCPPHLDAMGPLSEPPPNAPLGDARFHTPSKGIDHAVGGTEVPFTVLGGTLKVEDIQRDDAEGQMRARVRLRNLSDVTLHAEYLIVFFDDLNHRILSERNNWTGFVIEGLGAETVWNGCLLKDADHFVLYVRHGQHVHSPAPAPAAGAPMTPASLSTPVYVDIVPGGLRPVERPRLHSPSDR